MGSHALLLLLLLYIRMVRVTCVMLLQQCSIFEIAFSKASEIRSFSKANGTQVLPRTESTQFTISI